MVSKQQVLMTLLHIAMLLLSTYTLPVKDYPVPEKSAAHLFYIQRAYNTNTIVYEANFDEKGILIPKQPIKIFWLLFECNKSKEPLTRLENSFAYGIKHRIIENRTQEYQIQLVSYKKLKFRLRQIGPFQAEILYREGQLASKLDHIFVQANNNGLWTKVKYLEVYSRKTGSNKLIKEKILFN